MVKNERKENTFEISCIPLTVMLNATQVSKEEYVQLGSPALGERLAKQLRGQGHNPYIIPVGGSNALGTWGYIEATHEIQQQQPQGGAFTDIVMVGCIPLARASLTAVLGWAGLIGSSSL